MHGFRFSYQTPLYLELVHQPFKFLQLLFFQVFYFAASKKRIFNYSRPKPRPGRHARQHNDAGPSPGFSSRGGQKPGGAKNQKGAPHFKGTVLDVCSNQGTKREMGGAQILNGGGRAPLAPRWRRPCNDAAHFLKFATVRTWSCAGTFSLLSILSWSCFSCSSRRLSFSALRSFSACWYSASAIARRFESRATGRKARQVKCFEVVTVYCVEQVPKSITWKGNSRPLSYDTDQFYVDMQLVAFVYMKKLGENNFIVEHLCFFSVLPARKGTLAIWKVLTDNG